MFAGSGQVGKATSTTWSPTLKKVVSLGLVAKAHADPGARVDVEWTIEGTHERVGATVVPLPFLDLPRKRGWGQAGSRGVGAHP
jgi:aminomethyltransferase